MQQRGGSCPMFPLRFCLSPGEPSRSPPLTLLTANRRLRAKGKLKFNPTKQQELSDFQTEISRKLVHQVLPRLDELRAPSDQPQVLICFVFLTENKREQRHTLANLM